MSYGELPAKDFRLEQDENKVIHASAQIAQQNWIAHFPENPVDFFLTIFSVCDFSNLHFSKFIKIMHELLNFFEI